MSGPVEDVVGPRPGQIAAAGLGPAVEHELGPLGTLVGQLFVVGVLIHGFGVLHDRLPPAPASIALLALPALCLVLAPRRAVRRIRFSVPLALLLFWMALSWTWSINPAETLFRVWTTIPLLLALVVVGGLLRSDDLFAGVRWSIWATLALTVFTVATSAAARTSGNSEYELPGWRGTFTDKNSLALYLVFALAVTLNLDRGSSRWLTGTVVGVLLIGTQSATGVSAGLLVIVLTGWLLLLRGRRARSSALFVLASLALGLCSVAMVVANVASILEVYGRDADLTGRTDIWAAVVTAVEQRPLTGYGYGALLNPAAPSPATLALWRDIGFKASHAHNGVLDLVGQLGVIGLALYLLTVFTTVGAAARQLDRASRAGLAALVVLGAQSLMSVTENVFLGPWLLVLVLLQAGILADEEVPPGRRGVGTRVGGPGSIDHPSLGTNRH